MKQKEINSKMANRILRDLILDASEIELRDALDMTGDNFESIAEKGKELAERAIKDADNSVSLNDLHRGLGTLINMLRRQAKLSSEELAFKANVNVKELLCIETDPKFEPSPRTIFQLENYFKLPRRSLVVLSGTIEVGTDVREEAVRFAASAENITQLTKQEQNLLNRFIKFLQERTD